MVTIKELSENKEKLKTQINELLENFTKDNDGVFVTGLYMDFSGKDEKEETKKPKSFTVDDIELYL